MMLISRLTKSREPEFLWRVPLLFIPFFSHKESAFNSVIHQVKSCGHKTALYTIG